MKKIKNIYRLNYFFIFIAVISQYIFLALKFKLSRDMLTKSYLYHNNQTFILVVTIVSLLLLFLQFVHETLNGYGTYTYLNCFLYIILLVVLTGNIHFANFDLINYGTVEEIVRYSPFTAGLNILRTNMFYTFVFILLQSIYLAFISPDNKEKQISKS